MSNDIKIYFVLPSHYEDELSTSEEMQQAFELCRQNQIIPEWISEVNCSTTNFSKKDIVVFEKFEGETFQKVQTRLSVVGPWCIITCLLEGLQVPNNKSPIYNMSMYKLTVTASNYTAEEKKKMKEKVEMMGGVFSLNITSSVTHLITNSVRTQKYVVANAKGISVMLDSWVEDVWDCSLTRNVKATDTEFEKHKCPCFQNLRMCSTGFEVSERNNLQKLITKNGGTLSGKLLTASTDILICKPGTKSEKYDVAKRTKLPCVRIEWIFDSVQKGFALPEEEYVVKVTSSTPTKDNAPLNPDFSMMSIISGNENNETHRTSVSETINNESLFNMATPQARKATAQKENQEPDIVAEIDLQAVRKAGTFLDGCGVLLAGFSPIRRDKLCRILRSAGATRYDAISERVTQVLVGDPASHEVRLLGGHAPLVSAAWLMESIRRGQPAPEEPYIIQTGAEAAAPPAPSSPLSKKGLTLLQNDTSLVTDPELSKQLGPAPEEHESIKLYKNNKMNTEEDTLAQLLAGNDDNYSKCKTKSFRNEQSEIDISANEEDWYSVFVGKTFKLIDQTEEDSKKLIAVIEDVGGKVVNNNYEGVTDYAVVPPIIETVRHAASEVISGLWILDCCQNDELLTPQYYHQLISIASNAQPLQNCVITISGYSGYERQFLISLIRGLGATYQDKFAKVAKQNVLGNTHLVCLEASGGKWEAAQRWEKHIVTHEWLLRCAEIGQRVPEQDFILGKSNQNRTPVSNKRNLECMKISSATNKTNDVPITPAPLSIKRDFEGKRKSPISPTLAVTTTTKVSTPVTSTTDNSKNKKISPGAKLVAHNVNIPLNNEQKPGENPMLTLDDGRVLLLNNYMEELRAQGIYDTPSPLRPPASGTPVQELLARLRREGKLSTAQGGDTPTRNGSEFSGGSQGTPVGRYLRGLQERNVLPGSPKQAGGSAMADSPIPGSCFDVKTPDAPLGRFLGEDDPSRSTRKHWQRYLDRLPHYPLHERPAAPPRRPSTPWSEVKRQAWSWLFRDKDGNDSVSDSAPTLAAEHPAVPEPVTESQREVSNQIGQLQDMLKRRESSGPSRSLLLTLDGQGASTSSEPTSANIEAKDSQTDTVGWDEPMEDCVFSETTGPISGPRKFMLSAVEATERVNCCSIIRSLGGEISDLKFFDKTATHVVVSNPSRNEKILSSMAAGLWILHHSYVLQSAAVGRFLPEEDYALGNPKSASNLKSFIEPSPTTEAMHWWHEKVRQTGKGAFDGMRAMIFAKNTEAIVRLIEAGGGTILQASPPFAHSIDITHCFIETKLNLDYNEFIPLAEQGIPCLSILYLSNYLNNQTNVNVIEFIIPTLCDYYK